MVKQIIYKYIIVWDRSTRWEHCIDTVLFLFNQYRWKRREKDTAAKIGSYLIYSNALLLCTPSSWAQASPER